MFPDHFSPHPPNPDFLSFPDVWLLLPLHSRPGPRVTLWGRTTLTPQRHRPHQAGGLHAHLPAQPLASPPALQELTSRSFRQGTNHLDRFCILGAHQRPDLVPGPGRAIQDVRVLPDVAPLMSSQVLGSHPLGTFCLAEILKTLRGPGGPGTFLLRAPVRVTVCTRATQCHGSCWIPT